MKLLPLFPAILLLLRGAHAQGGETDFATEMTESTFKLFNPVSTATCFLVQRHPVEAVLYVVTAAHVLEKASGDKMVLVLRDPRPDGTYQRHDHDVEIRRDGKPVWTRHPQEDVGVLRLADPLPVPSPALPFSRLADDETISPKLLHIGSPVLVLTYPTRFEANEAGFPIARQGIVASHPVLPPSRHHTFIADFTTFDGDSGGPVFVEGSRHHPLVVGIVLAQFRHDETVRLEYEERTIHHPLGLGTVLQARFVRETIDLAAKAAVPAKPN